MTPLLTRPSIVSQLTPDTSPRGSQTDLELTSLKKYERPCSGLLMASRTDSHEETAFNEAPPTLPKTTPTYIETEPTLSETVPFVEGDVPLGPPPPVPDQRGSPHVLPLGFIEMTITVKKQVKRDIGLTLVRSGGITSGYPLVKRVLLAGVAHKSGIKRGDRLVSIDDQLVQGLTPEQIMPLFSEAPKEFPVVLWRQPTSETDGGDTPSTSSVYSGSVLTESSGRQRRSDSTSSLGSTSMHYLLLLFIIIIYYFLMYIFSQLKVCLILLELIGVQPVETKEPTREYLHHFLI